MNNNTNQLKSITQSKLYCKSKDVGRKNTLREPSVKLQLKRVVTVGKNTLTHFFQRCVSSSCVHADVGGLKRTESFLSLFQD